jgi:PAS domain S-box-containing protein
METPLRVLLIEDVEDEALLLSYELERKGCAVVCERVDTPAATEAALRRQDWDVVICDYTLPHFDFSAALALVKAFDQDLPFILVSGTVGEEIAVACMKAGAHDYVMKNNLPRLLPVIERELREAEVRRQKRRALEELTASEDRYRLLFERNVAGIIRSTLQGKILDCNEAFARMLGHASCKEIEAHSTWEFYRSRADRDRLLAQLREQGTLFSHELCFRHRDGSPVHALANVSLEEVGGEAVIHGTLVDITERKNAERRMAVEHAVARLLAESVALGDAAPKILQAISDELGSELGVLWTVDSSANVLHCVDVWHAPRAKVSEFVQACRQHTFSRGIGLPGRIWASGSAAWILDVSQEENLPRASFAIQAGLRGAVGCPIRDGGKFHGVMEFYSLEVRQPDEAFLEMMGGIGGQISQFLERRRLEKLLHEREREFDLARKIQQRLLPVTPPEVPGLEIGGTSRPARVVGGDHFDFLVLPDSRLAISIADASGHGIAAALLMAETCAYIRALALTHADVERILTLANRRLVEDNTDDHFVTLLLARLDPRTRCLVYQSAGHNPAYVLDGEGNVKSILPSTGTPLGLLPEVDFSSTMAITLAPGDLVFFYTDGVVESFSADGGQFGVERARDAVRAHRHQAPHQIIEALLRAASDFSGTMQMDDRTAVIIKVGPSASPQLGPRP